MQKRIGQTNKKFKKYLKTDKKIQKFSDFLSKSQNFGEFTKIDALDKVTKLQGSQIVKSRAVC